MEERIREKHPSYAMIQFSRISGGRGDTLFGSSIEHHNTIALRIYPATVERNLNSDWYSTDSMLPYIEVEMSNSQFAEAITSLNHGSGVPATLRYLQGKKIDEKKFINKRTVFEEEFTGRMEKLSDEILPYTEDAMDILRNKKSISKGDRETITRAFQQIYQEINSNIPFMGKMFNEQMDKTVKEAKGEIEAFTQHKVNSLGLQKLAELNSNTPDQELIVDSNKESNL